MRLLPKKDWPFKDKPVTNGYVRFTIYVTLYLMWLMLIFFWPGPTVLATSSVLLGMLIRAIYLSVAPEWRKN